MPFQLLQEDGSRILFEDGTGHDLGIPGENNRPRITEVKQALLVYNGTPMVERHVAMEGKTLAQIKAAVQQLPTSGLLFIKVIYTRTYVGGTGSEDGAGSYHFSDKIFGYDYYWFNPDGSWGGGLSTDAPSDAVAIFAGELIPNKEWHEISNTYCREVKVI